MKISNFYKKLKFLSIFSVVAICILSFKINEGKTIIVSKDGKGNFTTIQEAINSVEEGKMVRTKIIVKPGIYREKITVNKYITELVSFRSRSSGNVRSVFFRVNRAVFKNRSSGSENVIGSAFDVAVFKIIP